MYITHRIVLYNALFFVYRFVCHGLTTGEKYVFHVKAVNAAGISDFSQESEAIEVKAAIGESTLLAV